MIPHTTLAGAPANTGKRKHNQPVIRNDFRPYSTTGPGGVIAPLIGLLEHVGDTVFSDNFFCK